MLRSRIGKLVNGAMILAALFFISCSDDDSSSPGQTSNPTLDVTDLDVEIVENEIYREGKERAVFDLWWLPNAEEPTGLVMYVHGGGFISGDKSFVDTYQEAVDINFPVDIHRLLEQNVAFASINYTLLNNTDETIGVGKCLSDVKYALQFFKENAENYNLDPEKIIPAGNSAGGGSSMWLAVVNDLAEPDEEDPVLRQSTRVKGAVCLNTQATYNVFTWGDKIFQEYNFDWEKRMAEEDLQGPILRLFGVTELSEILTEEYDNYRRIIDMLARITEDDPELFVRTNRNKQFPEEIFEFNHHVNHAAAIKKKCESIGLPVVAYYGLNPPIYEDPTGEDWVEYCVRKINE